MSSTLIFASFLLLHRYCRVQRFTILYCKTLAYPLLYLNSSPSIDFLKICFAFPSCVFRNGFAVGSGLVVPLKNQWRPRFGIWKVRLSSNSLHRSGPDSSAASILVYVPAQPASINGAIIQQTILKSPKYPTPRSPTIMARPHATCLSPTRLITPNH